MIHVGPTNTNFATVIRIKTNFRSFKESQLRIEIITTQFKTAENSINIFASFPAKQKRKSRISELNHQRYIVLKQKFAELHGA